MDGVTEALTEALRFTKNRDTWVKSHAVVLNRKQIQDFTGFGGGANSHSGCANLLLPSANEVADTQRQTPPRQTSPWADNQPLSPAADSYCSGRCSSHRNAF